MEFTKQQLIGFLGALVLLIGVFLPILSAPILGSISLLNNGKSDGLIVCALAILSFILIFFNQLRLLWLTGGLSFVLISIDLYMVTNKISQTKAEVTEKLQGNPFGGFADAMMSSIQLQFGWVILYLGCIILLLTPILLNKRKIQDQIYNSEDDHQALNQTRNRVVGDLYNYNEIQHAEDIKMKSCPICSKDIRMTAIKCKYCNSMLE
ncbi:MULTISPECIES: hypothetical protein [Acinetobacter]|uniref:hypothetical protein n=1 Tax=Acinetobacter TaxID=469 RepID=UPI000C69CE31|nr:MULTISPECIES: hypothetical protein [unclassified Acinetobacter]MBC69752.1 hypothetical protein [Acinetobacter sp.]